MIFPNKTITLARKFLLYLFSVFLLSQWGIREARAVRPIDANVALVAGEGHAGFRDGSFTSALFHTPLGLAVSNDGNCLFVADSGNNRVRVIHLDQNNDVTTLAGQDSPGRLDGPLTQAQFNRPIGVLSLPDNRLVVNDSGNSLLRLVDLTAGTVTTLAGGPPAAAGAVSSSGNAVTLSPFRGIRDMAYMASINSVFFSQPDLNALKMLDLKTGAVSTVLSQSDQIDRPGALWCQGNKLYIADDGSPRVFETDWTDTSVTPVSIAAPLADVISLAWNGNILYGILEQEGVPIQRLLSDGQLPDGDLPDSSLVSYKSPWGDTIPAENLYPTRPQTFEPPIGFVPDPTDGRKFYVSKPEYNIIVSFRDLFGTSTAGGDIYNSNGLSETEYPARKPKNTFRILFVGDSRSTMMVNYEFPTDFHRQEYPGDYPRILSLSKQMERELNFQASLYNAPSNFEVLNLAHSATEPIFLWPAYQVPDIVKRNNIDLVVIFMPPNAGAYPYCFYFQNPITPEGIPQYPNDMEYLLKPPAQRIPPGVPQQFYDLCKAKGLVKTDGNTLRFDPKLFSDPDLHESLVQLYGKPLDVLHQKLSTMKTSSGEPVRLLLCSVFTGNFKENPEDPQLWVDAAKEFNFPILDLNAEESALRLSFFPLAESGASHLNPDGHLFFGRLLANVFIRDKLIPWK